MHRFTLLCLAAAAALGQEPGFVSLFDGKTLGGWVIEEGPPTAFLVDDGAIVVHSSANDPCWLRSTRQYENFDLRAEFFMQGWVDSGLYLHAPLHGKPADAGFRINLFHQADDPPQPNSMGSIFPIVAPRLVNVKSKGEWNDLRVLFDWPRLQVWVNGAHVHDLDVESVPELRYRLRSGYLGLVNLSYPIRFRNLRVRELPSRQQWESLYSVPADLAKWHVSEKKPNFEALGEVLRADGSGHIATNEKYKDFELQLYARGIRYHNGGVLFRSEGKGLAGKRHYEIQLHDVEGAHYPTGSLYYFKRARYPRLEPEKWYQLQLRVEGRRCLVRINGETVLEYDALEDVDEGHIELQAHRPGWWLEFKDVRIRRL